MSQKRMIKVILNNFYYDDWGVPKATFFFLQVNGNNQNGHLFLIPVIFKNETTATFQVSFPIFPSGYNLSSEWKNKLSGIFGLQVCQKLNFLFPVYLNEQCQRCQYIEGVIRIKRFTLFFYLDVLLGEFRSFLDSVIFQAKVRRLLLRLGYATPSRFLKILCLYLIDSLFDSQHLLLVPCRVN